MLRNLGLALFACCFASAMHAAPIKYMINMTGGSEVPSHPLAGASLKLEVGFDPATLVPIPFGSNVTTWPVSNSHGSLKVTGSAGADGLYTAAFTLSPTLIWFIGNDVGGFDSILFPVMTFQIGGTTVATQDLKASFPASFSNNPYPSVPVPFGVNDPTWNAAKLVTIVTPIRAISANNISGFSVVPEPSCAAILVGGSSISLAALRRRN